MVLPSVADWLRFGTLFDTPLFLRDPIEGSIETTRAPSLLTYDMVRSWNRCRGRCRGATGLARVERAVVPVHEGGRVRRNLAIRPTSPSRDGDRDDLVTGSRSRAID
jgi:hypothetical protein